MSKKMSRREILVVLDRVFEHYLDCDISDEEKEEVEIVLDKVKEFIWR